MMNGCGSQKRRIHLDCPVGHAKSAVGVIALDEHSAKLDVKSLIVFAFNAEN